MKKSIAITLLFAFVAIVAVSCKHTQPCPAYGKVSVKTKNQSV